MHPLNQLNLHLQLVATSLPLATQKRPETVHQLRVNTRRSLSALSVFGGLLDPQEAKWMRKQLRRIRKAAGAARDLDVLELRYKKHKGPRDPQLLGKIRKRRRDAQRPIDRLTESDISSRNP